MNTTTSSEQMVDLADIRCELEAMRARLEVMQACVGGAAAANPALLGRGWVVQLASVVAVEFGVHIDDIMGKCRKPNSVKPRQTWTWLIRNAGSFSYPQVARMTGYGDHTTAIWACQRIDGYRERDGYFRAVTDQLLRIAKSTREDALKAGRARAAAMHAHDELLS